MKKPAPLAPFDRVEAARARLGLSAQELCRRAKLAPNTLAQARSSGGALSLPTLQALSVALGCPLSELLGEAPPAVASSSTTAGGPPRFELPLSALHPSPLNPRKTFDPEKLAELAASITENGILEPLMVRPRSQGGYWIVFGERRYRAALLSAEQDPIKHDDFMVPATIRELSDAEHLTIALIENGQREDVPPLEEAEGYAALQKLDPKKWTANEIARQIGKSGRHVQLRLALLTKLDKSAIAGMQAGKISMAQARELMLVPKSDQAALAKDLAKGEDMTADQIREQLMEGMVPVENALFDVEASGLEIYTDPDNAKDRYFVDKAAFVKKQNKAVDALANDLRKEWKFVQIVNYFEDWTYEASKDKAKAGCIIVYRKGGGRCEVHKGFIKKKSGHAAASVNYDARNKTRRAKEKAGEAMTAALADRLRKDRPNVLRLLLLSAISSYNTGSPHISPTVTKGMVADTALKAIAALVVARGDHMLARDQVDGAALWKAIASIPDAKLDELIHTAALQSLRCEAGQPLTWFVAEGLGVTLEAKHDEVWRKSLQRKVKGIMKRQVDLEDAIAKKKAAE